MKNKKPKEKKPMLRSFNAEIKALEGENKNRFELSFASEEPYERWFGIEILCCEEAAVDLERLNTIGVVLYNHDRDRVIGKIIKAWVEGNRCHATIEFDEDEESQIIADKVRSGTLKAVSVGYIINAREEVKANKTSANGRFTGPCVVATQWAPFEVSIVSVPADSTVGVGRKLEDEDETEEESEDETEEDGEGKKPKNKKPETAEPTSKNGDKNTKSLPSVAEWEDKINKNKLRSNI